MRRFEYGIAVLLALAGVGFDAWAFISRCPSSPAVSIPVLSFGLLVQAIAVGLPLVREVWFQSATAKHGAKAIIVALGLFVGSAMMIRSSVLYSDAIGKPNYFKSAGLACPLSD